MLTEPLSSTIPEVFRKKVFLHIILDTHHVQNPG